MNTLSADVKMGSWLGMLADYILLALSRNIIRDDMVCFVLGASRRKTALTVASEPQSAFRAVAVHLLTRLENAFEKEISTEELHTVKAAFQAKGKTLQLADLRLIKTLCLEAAKSKRLSIADFKRVRVFFRTISEYTP